MFVGWGVIFSFIMSSPLQLYFFPKLYSRDRQGQWVLLFTALLSCTGGAELQENMQPSVNGCVIEGCSQSGSALGSS